MSLIQNSDEFISYQNIGNYGEINQTTNVIKTEKIREDPKCAMCRNHGYDIPTKDHKTCDFKTQTHYDTCNICKITNERRISISEEIKILRQNKAAIMNEYQLPTRGKRGPQMCRKCGFHGLIELMKGHTKICPFLSCTCEKGCDKVKIRCKAFNSEAKIIRKLKPILKVHSKGSNYLIMKVPITSIDQQNSILHLKNPLPQFNRVFGSPIQASYENPDQISVSSYSDTERDYSCVSDLIEPINFLNQYKPIYEDVKADHFLEIPSLLEPVQSYFNDSSYPCPQVFNNFYENLNETDYDVEIGSVMDNFMTENIDSFMEELNYNIQLE
ncbi:hypothetical protein ACKWTF_001031 [Chironomus riparius]